jgi:hypothetical protein
MNTKGPDRNSIRKSQENRTPESSENRNDYFDGDARRDLEATRSSKEPHVVEPPREPEDMQSRVPLPSVGVRHSAQNPLAEVLEHNADAALNEATNARHAHIDRAHKGASIQK